MKVTLKCDFCGKEIQKYPSKVKGKNFCGRDCTNKYASKEHNPDGYKYRSFEKNSKRFTAMNKALNPERMTQKTREKLRVARLGSGAGKSYEKTFGRHTHRVVAEQILGRQLTSKEVVHHIDGNKRNNSPDNLMVFASQEEHAAFHAKENQFFGAFITGQEVMPK